MTQKEITMAKKKSKECLDVFDIKVPMTKMNILFFYIKKDMFFINFYDVRTHDYFTCECANNDYYLSVNVKETGKTHFFTRIKGGETID